MTLAHSVRLRLLAAPLAAFAAALLAFALLHHGHQPPAPRTVATASLRSSPLEGAVAPSSRGGALEATGTAADLPRLQASVRAQPERADLRAALAAAYRQRVRETGDAAFYTRAAGVLAPALKAHPRDPEVLTEAGLLALSRHDFRGGLALGRRAQAAAPALVDASAVTVDALVELGRYGAARGALQRMVDLKPNLAAYARVSYLRELHGDLTGAARAMALAVAAGGPALENAAYASSQLGELERQLGQPAAARRDFRAALAAVPRHPGAEAGLARVAAARGDLAGAIRRLRGVTARLPLPEYVVALGEAELAAGRRAAAARDLALVRVEERLLTAAGVNTDVELALFEADHGDRARALALARRAYAAAPSIRAADAVGWALTRAGRPQAGLAWAHRALRLRSHDPLWRFHAGMTALAAGRRDAGRALLRDALAHGLAGTPWRAQQARRALEAGVVTSAVGRLPGAAR